MPMFHFENCYNLSPQEKSFTILPPNPPLSILICYTICNPLLIILILHYAKNFTTKLLQFCPPENGVEQRIPLRSQGSLRPCGGHFALARILL